MRMRGRPHKERVTILVTLAASLAAASIASASFAGTRGADDWNTAGSLLLWGVAITLGIASAYIFLHFFWPQLPLLEPRQRAAVPLGSAGLPPIFDLRLPYWLSSIRPRKAVANDFLAEGKRLLSSLPSEPENPLVVALAGFPPHRYLKQVVQWEERVAIFLQARADDCTALFNRSPGIPPQGPALRSYLEARLAELTAIHAQL